MGRVSGKVALVTGAAMGMGEQHALGLAREGAKVIVADVESTKGEAVARAICKAGGEAIFRALDVRDEAQWQSVIADGTAEFGKIDVLVNNAGIIVFKGVQDTTLEEWDRIFDINVKGVFLGTKHILPAMQAAGGGSIVNISSIYGIIGAPGSAAYQATKGAVRLLTKATAVDYAAFNIRVNSVHPGVIDTPMIKDLMVSDEIKLAATASVPLQRPAQPQEVTGAVLLLASDEASYMTGSEIVVDGGYTAV